MALLRRGLRSYQWKDDTRSFHWQDDPSMKAAAPYHHGSLRDALVEAAVELVTETGAAEVSLRAVARRAGVSHSAAYHHFADRGALLAATAAHGLDALTMAMRRGARRAATQPEAFR